METVQELGTFPWMPIPRGIEILEGKWDITRNCVGKMKKGIYCGFYLEAKEATLLQKPQLEIGFAKDNKPYGKFRIIKRCGAY